MFLKNCMKYKLKCHLCMMYTIEFFGVEKHVGPSYFAFYMFSGLHLIYVININIMKHLVTFKVNHRIVFSTIHSLINHHSG